MVTRTEAYSQRLGPGFEIRTKTTDAGGAIVADAYVCWRENAVQTAAAVDLLNGLRDSEGPPRAT